MSFNKDNFLNGLAALTKDTEFLTRIDYALSLDQVEDLYSLEEAIREAIETEASDHFIYYDDAIMFLVDNDPSLEDSYSLAMELGFSEITSCLLANLLWENLALREVEDFIPDNEETLLQLLGENDDTE